MKNLDNHKWLKKQYISKDLSIIEISKILDSSRMTVTRRLKILLKSRKSFIKNHPYLKKLKDKDWLYQKYVMEDLSEKEIGIIFNVTASTVSKYIKKFNIKKDLTLPKEIYDKQWLTENYLIKNYSAEEISKNLKTSKYSVLHYLRKFSIVKDHSKIYEGTVRKGYKTRKINKTFNTSKPEQEILKLLKSVYPDIKYQYKSKRYPFNCDYYVPEKDLYIEFQGNWTHGKEPYNGYNLDLKWVKKAEDGSNYYKNAIKVYVKKDPLKRETAIKNNLNYLEIWYSDYKKGMEWFEELIQSY